MTRYAVRADLTIKKPVTLEKAVYAVSLFISCLSVFYLISVFVTGQTWQPTGNMKSDPSELVLSLIQCILGIAAFHLPVLIKKLTCIKLPDGLCTGFYIFVLCGTVFGEVFSLYYIIPFWDDLLHCGSGIMTGMLGSILIVSFLQKRKCESLISPVFIAAAAVCFAVCIGTVWEIYEFALDSLLGLNMQKCLLQDGAELIGKAALSDTMTDLIVDSVGASISGVSTYISLKHKN